MKTIIIDGIEYNLTPKVLFKKGDWIVFNGLTLYIKEVVKGYYRTISKGDITNSYDWDIDNVARLWTIQDAKDGDVLVDEDNNIGIYKEIEGICWHSYIYLGCDNRLYGFSIGGSHIQSNTKPATKEQHDTLMKAMADAGYTFDFEKKELKKIEQKPTWSEENCNRISSIKYLLHELNNYNFDNWLDSLKERYTWKPSDEQMDALYTYIYNPQYFSSPDPRMELVESVYKDLKKLKEK